MITPSVSRAPSGGWAFSWPFSNSAGYDAYLNGVLWEANIQGESYTFPALPGYDSAPPDLEIVATGATPDSANFPPRFSLQWRGVLNAIAYVIQRDRGVSSPDWRTVESRTEDGSGYYTWTSPALNDGESRRYRVLAVNIQGQSGSGLELEADCVRHPEAPSVSFGINSAGDVEVSSA